MADISDVLKFMEKDPIAGYVSIPVVAARPPAPRIIVELSGRNLVLPDWTGLEWAWYGSIANDLTNDVGTGVHRRQMRGSRDVQRARSKLAPLMSAMKGLVNNRPLPQDAGAFYNAAVRLLIAAQAAVTTDPFGPIFVESVKEAFKEVPQTIGLALAATLRTGAEVLGPVAKEAGKIAVDIFGAIAKSGIGLIAIAALGLWWYLKQGNRKESENG